MILGMCYSRPDPYPPKMQIKAGRYKYTWFITYQQYHTSVKMKLMSIANKKKKKMLILLDIPTLNKSNIRLKRSYISHRKETV
jgi:hypothetical protein